MIMIYYMPAIKSFLNAIKFVITEPNGIDILINESPVNITKTNPNIFDIIYICFNTSPISYDIDIVFGTIKFQMLIPLFAIVSGIEFYKFYNSIYKFKAIKIKNRKKNIIYTIMINSLKLSIAVFLAYFIFLIIINSFADPYFNASGTRDFLLDIFGKGIYFENKFLYYFLEGFFRFFMIPFVYASFTQMGVLYFIDIKKIVAMPLIYYYGLTLLAYGLFIINDKIAMYISPATIMANGTFENINSIKSNPTIFSIYWNHLVGEL